ncbi:MAG: hypothetical protein IT454_16485 [Planctomycetes bacterium]|nr:hypothetical protein [Planctomycetota bacterium]
MSFDDRWRELAARARAQPIERPLSATLAARARSRPREGRPWIAPRWGWPAAACAALSVALLAPIAFDDSADSRAGALLEHTLLPAPPRLPTPPALESPGHYVALVRATWKELRP